MAKTETYDALLVAALQDLRAAADLLGERLPAIRNAAQAPALRAAFAQLIAAARERSAALTETGKAAGGPECLWMKGVADDADRDRASVTPGPLLDTALIGAIRKGMVAMAAADETAIALARGLADHPLASRLDRLRDAALAGDKALHVLLDRSARGAQ